MTSDYIKSSLWGQRVGGDAAAQVIQLLLRNPRRGRERISASVSGMLLITISIR